MAAFTAVYRARLAALLQSIEAGTYDGKVPGEADHNAVIEAYAIACWRWGWVHGAAELDRIESKFRRFQLSPPPAPPGPLPTEAIAWAKSRVELAGKWNRSLDQSVNDLVVQSLQEGWSGKRLQQELKSVFPTFTAARLENIARTETISAYNAGRMAKFGMSTLIVAYQFSAILDARTTDTCKARNGRILVVESISEAELAYNTPPLHYQCRSVLIPIDKYDMEDLAAGKPEALEDYFGWAEGGPRTLNEATDWRSMPKPLAGFGAGDVTPTPKTKAEPAAEPSLADKVKEAAASSTDPIDSAKAAGRVILDAILPDKATLVAPVKEAESRFDELGKEAMKLARRLSSPGVRPQLEAMVATLETLREEVRIKREQFEAAWHEKLRETFAGIRPMGGSHILNWGTATAKARGEVNGILSILPTNWGQHLAKHTLTRPMSAVVKPKRNGQPGRASYVPQLNKLNLSGDRESALHEVGHWLDESGLWPQSKQFLDRRTVGEQARKLSVLTGTRRYKADEVAKKDAFVNPYMGKIYPPINGVQHTEIHSMALEGIWFDRLGIMEQDEDVTTYILGLLATHVF